MKTIADVISQIDWELLDKQITGLVYLQDFLMERRDALVEHVRDLQYADGSNGEPEEVIPLLEGALNLLGELQVANEGYQPEASGPDNATPRP